MTPRRPVRAAVAVLAGAAAVAGCTARGGAGRLGVRAAVVEAPRTVPTPAGDLTVYELEVRNGGDDGVLLERVGRRRTDRAGEESVSGEALGRRVVLRARPGSPESALEIGSGGRAVVLLEAVTPRGGPPPAMLHEVSVRRAAAGSGAPSDAFSSAERDAATGAPAALGPPVAGDGWRVENGPATLSGHRRAVVWLRRAPRAAQRFAIDLFRVGPDGRTCAGDVSRNESHLAFGAEVLAVADATVAAATDGIPDNAPDPGVRAVEMTGETLAGNHVVLDLGDGRFAFYAHLRLGSVAVAAGARVRRGDAIGRIGNSGNSTEPHLHLHVADGPSPVDASGLPFVFESFSVAGAQLAGVLPDEGSVVAFPRRESSATTGTPSDDAAR